jgi:hypothetical protein
MISQSAKNSLDQSLMLALKGAMVAVDGDLCEVTKDDDISGILESKVVMLTSSSYVFRVFVLIYFEPDDATREHFARRSRTSLAELTEQTFIDALCESGNMCSGAFNRDLGREFPHVGLSTPNILDRSCADNLAALNGGHVQHFRIDVNQATLFHASLCVCDYADMDFTFAYSDAPAEGEVSNGELEMF